MLPMLAALALGTGISQDPPKPILTPPEVMRRLELVVMFTLADKEGKPLIIEGPISKFGVFVSAKDAATSLEQLKTSKPEAAGLVKVTAITLSQAYQIELDTAGTNKPLLIQFIANQVEVDAAQALMKAQGRDPAQMRGIPVFAPKLKSRNMFLTINYAGGKVYPFFLSMADLQPLLDRFRAANPSSASDIIVEVTTMEGVVKNLQTSPDVSIAMVALIHSTETKEFVKAAAGGSAPSR